MINTYYYQSRIIELEPTLTLKKIFFFWSNPYAIEVNFSIIDNFFYENARFTKSWS